MKKLSQPELEEAFVDVRKAYRLLYHYQRRVLDLVKFIGDHLGCKYKSGHPKFSNASPRDGKGSLDLYAWDWLNMYLYEFHLGHLSVDGKKLAFSILLQSDTGYFDLHREGRSKLSVEKFVSPEASQTRLVLVVGYNTWKPAIFDDPNKYLNGNDSYISKKEEKVICVKAYNLSSFTNEESTLALIDDFNDFCTSNGIPIK